MIKSLSLAEMFNDESFAWNLLEYQIRIQRSEQPDGLDISNLLQLYMRGVQVMNTNLDPRESYFKSKVTDLMGKNTVRKTFKTKQQTMIEQQKKKQNQSESQNPKKQQKKLLKKKSEVLVSPNVLQQKKKQLQLRLAYSTEQINPESLKKMLKQNEQNQMKITNKVQNLIEDGQKRLNERINRRKLKSSTYRSRQDQVETLNAIEQEQTDRKNNITVNIKGLNKINGGGFQVIPESPLKNNQRRLYKSLQRKQKVSKLDDDTGPNEQKDNANPPIFQYRKQSVDFYQLKNN